jgi:hypothetical protein
VRDTGAIDDSFTIIKGDPEPLRVCFLTLKDGKVILCWKSTRSQCYRIERSECGQPLSWQPASDPITAVGATTVWTNVLSLGPIGLYRVVELPPPLAAKLTGEPNAP